MNVEEIKEYLTKRIDEKISELLDLLEVLSNEINKEDWEAAAVTAYCIFWRLERICVFKEILVRIDKDER